MRLLHERGFGTQLGDRKILRDEDKKEIQKRLSELRDPVKLVFFTQKLTGTCQYCEETERLLKEVAELSEKLELEILNFVTDKDRVDEMKIDKIPGIAILGSEDLGLRFYGIPTGYEFATFLDTLLKASSGLSGLPEALKKKLERVDKPVHIQVFVTPTCPYCPVAALTALKLAMENDHITADVVEITEFPHLSQKYGVMGVPKVILNEVHSFEGALSEDLFVEHVLNIGLDNSERA